LAKNSLSTARRFSGYVVQRRLGSGAGSAIFEVVEPASGQPYALKRVVKRTASDDRFFRQTENEYEIGRQVQHPAVRAMHQLYRIRPFFRVKELHLVMEMFYGQTMESRRPSNALAVTRIFKQLVQGLEAMHAAGFAHADIKPNNVLVGNDGAIRIIDLGQSCPLGTVKQRIQGTPDYIAPEQVYRQPIDRTTDVFNVGATLYWVLSGRHVPTVLPRSQPGREIALVTSTVTEPPDQINPRVPPALSRLAMDCVKVSPSERPENMRVLLDRLDTIELVLTRNGQAYNQVGGGRKVGASADEDWGVGEPGEDESETVDLPGIDLGADPVG